MFGWSEVSKQNVVDLLTAIRDLFADESKWLFWPRAEDKTGLAVDPTSEQAVKWSLMGAGEMLAAKLFEKPLDAYVECAVRDVLDELSDGKFAHGMEYSDEYALVCLVLEHLTKEESK